MAKKQYLTVTEAAKKLKLTRAGVHEAIRAGRLASEWMTVAQTHVVKKRVRVISAKSIAAFEVDIHQQLRGKKN
jgi:hypothetical protein